jgi:hypothetical protein
VEPEFEQLFRLTLSKNPEQRPSAQQLKKFKLFEGVDFAQIFSQAPPISEQELAGRLREGSSPRRGGAFLFERALEKRMFFGNYKPRLLTVEEVGGRLLMAYRYIPSKRVKHEFELNLNDYAVPLKNNEFEVVTTDKRYRFRVGKQQSTEAMVEEINAVIRSRYALE